MANQKSEKTKRQTWRRAVSAVAVSSALGYFVGASDFVSAYEWQSFGARSCSSGNQVTINAHTFGDWNLYTNYGWANARYDIPYDEPDYAVAWTGYNSVSDTAAEAENYVSSGGTDCILKF